MIESRVATVVIQAAGSSIGASWRVRRSERLLGHVLGLRDAAQHPVRHAEAVPPQRLELHVVHASMTADDGRM